LRFEQASTTTAGGTLKQPDKQKLAKLAFFRKRTHN
jgi:hypothetical protein